MNLRRLPITRWCFLVLILLVFLPGFTTQRDTTRFLKGKIEAVDESLKFIMVNGIKVHISSATKIMNERGSALTISDLKPQMNVIIDGSRDKQEVFAKRIQLKIVKNRKP